MMTILGSKRFVIQITVRAFRAAPCGGACDFIKFATTALHPTLHHTAVFVLLSREASRVHLTSIATANHELLQPWLSRSRTTPATFLGFTVFKAARWITGVFTTQNTTATTTSV